MITLLSPGRYKLARLLRGQRGTEFRMGNPVLAGARVVALDAAVFPIPTPDWLPGVVPRCVPVETKRNQYGEQSTTVVVGIERVLHRMRWRTVEVLACPVTWRPNPEQIASARRGYEDWWLALDWVRDGLVAGGMLREVEVTAAMPKVRPWHGKHANKPNRM